MLWFKSSCYYVMLSCSFWFFTSPETWDVKINSELKRKKKRKNVFSCLQWNVIQVNKTHNKSPLLEAYNTIHNFDILFISETYLDSFVSVGDTSLSHPSYNLVWLMILTMLKGVELACITKRIYLELR